jgi:hypothetical protein
MDVVVSPCGGARSRSGAGGQRGYSGGIIVLRGIACALCVSLAHPWARAARRARAVPCARSACAGSCSIFAGGSGLGAGSIRVSMPRARGARAQRVRAARARRLRALQQVGLGRAQRRVVLDLKQLQRLPRLGASSIGASSASSASAPRGVFALAACIRSVSARSGGGGRRVQGGAGWNLILGDVYLYQFRFSFLNLGRGPVPEPCPSGPDGP